MIDINGLMKEALHLEQKIRQKLQEFKKIKDEIEQSDEELQDIEIEYEDKKNSIQSILTDFLKIINECESHPNITAAQSMNISQYRRFFNTSSKRFSKLDHDIGRHLKQRLLLQPGDDFTTENSQSDLAGFSNNQSAIASLGRSQHIVNTILDYAPESLSSIIDQRKSHEDMNTRLTSLNSSNIPVLNQFMKRISSKKKRDVIILGIFIAFLIIIGIYLI
mmetsp:Transcript_249/g.455  ORF Transcript_249/g.455 Transcript_249/m.455 type:complete len:220 (-) Transcript_249:1863-2522(-)